MSSIDFMRNYKHDISGKFKDIVTALSPMNNEAFDDPEKYEIFHAIHEVLLKMVKTSRNTIQKKLKQEIVLLISDQLPDVTLDKLQIEGVVVRYVIQNSLVTYHLSLAENAGDPVFLLGKIHSVLPVTKIKNTISNKDLHQIVDMVVAREF